MKINEKTPDDYFIFIVIEISEHLRSEEREREREREREKEREREGGLQYQSADIFTNRNVFSFVSG